MLEFWRRDIKSEGLKILQVYFSQQSAKKVVSGSSHHIAGYKAIKKVERQT